MPDRPVARPAASRWWRPDRADVLAAAAAGLAVTLLLIAGRDGRGHGLPAWIVPVAAAGQVLPVLARRRWPLGVICAAGVAGGCCLAAGAPAAACLPGLLAAAYAAAVYGRPPRPVIGLALAVPAAAAFALPDPITRLRLLSAAVLALLAALAWLAGYAARTRRAYVAGLVERAERAERERAEQAARAVAEERLRIARELHDAVGHAVSVIAIHSDAAARTLAADPEAAAGYLRAIQAASRETMTELRQILRVLRPGQGPEQEWDTAPGLAGLPDLAAKMEAAGVPVRLETGGDLDGVPLGAQMAAYRIVQEALTNVLRHAGPGAQAQVRVCRERLLLRLAVTDDGAGTRAAAGGAPGHGMLSMRERAAVYGGTLRAGPSADGFEVRAEIPLGE